MEGQSASPMRGRGPALGLAISAVCLAGVIWWVSDQSAPTLPSSSGAMLILLTALAVYASTIVLRGARWSMILMRAGIACRPTEPYALTVVGYMGNNVLPLRGGEVLRVVLLTDRSSAGWREALGSIIPERLLDMAALVLLLVTVTVAHIGGAPAGEAPAIVAGALLVAAVAAGFGYLALRRRGYFDWFAEMIRPYARASRTLFTLTGAGLLALSVGIWLLEAGVFWLVAESLEIDITLFEALMVDILASFSALIPAGPGYIGTYDAAMLFALGAIGVTSGAALTFAILVRFVVFVPVTICGLLLVVLRYGGLSRLARRRRRGEAELASS
jgi:uncharacterized membrane protein YbhN (UPF0104 family)